MSIIIKKIGKKGYAYEAVRKGRGVLHNYIGPVSNPDVSRLIEFEKETGTLPRELHRFFWDTDATALDIKADASYIIARLLEYGTIAAVQWLQKAYPTKKIVTVLLQSRSVSSKSRNFWEYWFGLRHA